MKRMGSLHYFSQLSADRMSIEPRLSALSVFGKDPYLKTVVRAGFSDAEWSFYNKQREMPSVKSSSMGRLIDAVAAALSICNKQSYEGEAAMLLEALAWRCKEDMQEPYFTFIIKDNEICLDLFVSELSHNIREKKSITFVARKFWLSLASFVLSLIKHYGCHAVALSGGVFQNVFLLEDIHQMVDNKIQIYIHKELSPNDESIAFGQLALYQMHRQNKIRNSYQNLMTCA